jgi:hypothetical protein
VMKVGVSCTIQKQNLRVHLAESKKTESSESENAKITGEYNVGCIFFILKVSFITNLCLKNRL